MKTDQTIFGFQKTKLKQWFLYWSVVGAGLFVLLFLVTTTWIGVSVKEKCQIAQGKYEGDCVDALSQVLDDGTNSLRERNDAIWALGQLGDQRARPTIAKYYTGNIPDREPYDATLSQYEMKKALNLIDSGFNITHFVWQPF